MELQIIALYFFSDEILKARNFRDDPQVKMTTAEVITVALASALLFYGNQKRAVQYLKNHRFLPYVLSESHFNRRLHRILPDVWQAIFSTLAEYFKHSNSSQEYIVDIPKQPEESVFDCVGIASYFSSTSPGLSMNNASRRSQKI